jgi:hypothetical protein
MFWDLQTWTLDLYIDVFWYGVIQRGRSPFVRIALPFSLMLWLRVVHRLMELAYYPRFVPGHLVAARYNIYIQRRPTRRLCMSSEQVVQPVLSERRTLLPRVTYSNSCMSIVTCT